MSLFDSFYSVKTKSEIEYGISDYFDGDGKHKYAHMKIINNQ